MQHPGKTVTLSIIEKHDVELEMQEFRPCGVQIEALYALRKTREEGEDKALVYAATGIGKTYLAAFDSKSFDRVLFVAVVDSGESISEDMDIFRSLLAKTSCVSASIDFVTVWRSYMS